MKKKNHDCHEKLIRYREAYRPNTVRMMKHPELTNNRISVKYLTMTDMIRHRIETNSGTIKRRNS